MQISRPVSARRHFDVNTALFGRQQRGYNVVCFPGLDENRDKTKLICDHWFGSL